MNKTAVLVLAALAATATSGVASAYAQSGGGPACNYIVGQPGAGHTFTGSDNQMDILSADIGSDSRNVTVVLRLAALAAVDPNTSGGRTYRLTFQAPGQPDTLYISAVVDPVQNTTASTLGTQTFDFGAMVPVAGNPAHSVSAGTGATGRVDYTAHTITLNVPVASWSPLAVMTPGVVLSAVAASASYVIGAAGSGVAGTGNTVKATTGFTLGTPTCVVPGTLG